VKDLTPCAVLHRKKPSAEWELCYYTKRISHAWRLQLWIAEEEVRTNPRQQTVTLLREDYDADRFKVLRVPGDFDIAKVPRDSPVELPRPDPVFVTPPPPDDMVAKPVPMDMPDPPELAGAW